MSSPLGLELKSHHVGTGNETKCSQLWGQLSSPVFFKANSVRDL